MTEVGWHPPIGSLQRSRTRKWARTKTCRTSRRRSSPSTSAICDCSDCSEAHTMTDIDLSAGSWAIAAVDVFELRHASTHTDDANLVDLPVSALLLAPRRHRVQVIGAVPGDRRAHRVQGSELGGGQGDRQRAKVLLDA